MERHIYDPTVQPLYNNPCHWTQAILEQQQQHQQYLHHVDNTNPIYCDISDTYSNINMQVHQRKTSGEFCPRILDIHRIYASSLYQGLGLYGGIYPHLMTDEELASLECFLNKSQKMEDVWHGSFAVLTHALQSQIQLKPLYMGQNLPSENWTEHKEDAKVRFMCQFCQNGWTSMQGKVVFYYNFDYANRTGDVYFKLFGQQCKNCPGTFQHAMWYPQEVIRVIRSLTYKIGQTVYQIPRPKVLRVRRGGSPKEKHENDMCQACIEGVCSSLRLANHY